MADVTISNVREIDDHKEYLVLWGDERGEVWTHEKEAKEVCPKAVKSFKKMMKEKKEEKKRRKSIMGGGGAGGATVSKMPVGAPPSNSPPPVTEKKSADMPPPPVAPAVVEQKKEKKEMKEPEMAPPCAPLPLKEPMAPPPMPPTPPVVVAEINGGGDGDDGGDGGVSSAPAPAPAPVAAPVTKEPKKHEPLAKITVPRAAPAPASATPNAAPPARPQTLTAEDDHDANSQNSDDEDLSQLDEPPEKPYRVVREEGAIVRKYADMSSPLVGTVAFGEVLTCTDTNRLWFDDNNFCVGMKPDDADDDEDGGYWRIEVLSPNKFKGWISLKSHIISRVFEEPAIIHRQALRKKAEALHEITKSMVEVSLVAARHSAQLRMQRQKVFSGCSNLVAESDPRVLGVLGQMSADEMYETRVNNHIRKGLDRVTSQFLKVQEAESELINVIETYDYDESAEDVRGGMSDPEFLKLNEDIYVLQREYVETESRVRQLLG
ncbi:hypothetical protein TL16_g10062 [Triparma laevis f. inornata]|uniref:Uncharacterized protein n=1 Tax=Triparma laevis f. inornata TaxID=1714386 RepID=A0A9W7BBH0_9STRA|nr:hypothetical protein TL16_g10062 [Triparma laevis f. inornata]